MLRPDTALTTIFMIFIRYCLFVLLLTTSGDFLNRLKTRSSWMTLRFWRILGEEVVGL